MEYHNSLYVLFVIFTIFLSSLANKSAIKKGKEIWQTVPFYLMLFFFAAIVGTRYLVGLDYSQYMDIVINGKSHYYYEHMEYMNRLFVDIVNNLGLDFYWWFIFMAFVQVFFMSIAVKDNYRKAFPWIIFCFFMLYISFYVNGVRQGAALSCFIYAATFIKDRKLYHYLACMLFASFFHKSVLLWIPIYWIANREFLKNIEMQYIIFFISILVLPSLFTPFLRKALPLLDLIGYSEQATSLIGNKDFDIEVGSGLGVLFRYLRWILIIAYYNKLKDFIGKETFIPLYNLFFIGIIFDAATMQIIAFNRMMMYGAIFEIFILGVLFYYMTKTSNLLDKIVLFTLFILQTILSLVLPLTIGSFKWHTIWDMPYITF